MTADPIICGVDDSESAQVAVSVAAGLAQALESAVVLLHVASPQPAVTRTAGPYTYKYRDEHHPDVVKRAGEELLERLARVPRLAGRGGAPQS